MLTRTGPAARALPPLPLVRPLPFLSRGQTKALIPRERVGGLVRFTARARCTLTPRELWHRLEDLRAWGPLLNWPGADAAPLRVKVTSGSAVAGADPDDALGTTLQALRQDKSWTTYRITNWRPGKQLDLEPVASGHGEEPGEPVRPRRAERVVVIPQGGGAEVECTVVVDIGVVGRVLGPLATDRSGWQHAVAERVAWLTETPAAEIRVETATT